MNISKCMQADWRHSVLGMWMSLFNSTATMLFLVALFILSTTFALQINEGCVSRTTKTGHILGNEMYIKVFVPKDDSAVLLSIATENGKTTDKREIQIFKTFVFIQELYGGVYKCSNVSLSDSLIPLYWTEFEVKYESRFQVSVQNNTFVDIEDRIKSRSVVLRGNYVTLNCNERTVAWELESEEVVHIPLEDPMSKVITIYPMNPSTPVLTLGTMELSLSWDERRRSITVHDISPEPLPPFHWHNFTIDCVPRIERSFCNIKVGEHDVLASKLLPAIATSVSMSASVNDAIIIMIATGKSEILSDYETESYLTTDAVEPVNLNIPLVSFLSIALVLVIGVSLFRYIRQKRSSTTV